MGHSQSSRSGTKTFSVDFKSQSRTTAVVHHSAIDGIEHSVSTYSIPMCPRRHVLEIILYRPEIPQNTGNIGRLCAFIGNCRLHLIHPLGFTISEKAIRRSGMDYWQALEKNGDIVQHSSWEDFLASPLKPSSIYGFSASSTTSFWDVTYKAGDGLLFGPESSGLPLDILQAVKPLNIPRGGEAMRSLNVSTAVGVAAYEAMRQVRHR